MTIRSSRGNLGRERPQHRRLPCAGRPGDDDLLARSHRGARNVLQLGVDRTEVDQVVERHLHEPVAADRQRRPVADPRHREQPAAVGELQVQRRPARVELALRQAVAAADLAQRVDELVVAVGDSWSTCLAPVGVLDEDLVAAVRDDVLDLLVVEQRLQPAEFEQVVEHRVGECVLDCRSSPGCPATNVSRAMRSSSTLTS